MYNSDTEKFLNFIDSQTTTKDEYYTQIEYKFILSMDIIILPEYINKEYLISLYNKLLNLSLFQ